MDDVEQLAFVGAQLRDELRLLHERVNALLAAEAFLTIAYTAAMSNGAPWGAQFAAVVAPVLSVLGLVLAVLVWPGVATTVQLVLAWTRDQEELLDRLARLPDSAGRPVWRRGGSSPVRAQRRSLLFFRAVPATFAVVWSVLTVVALVLTR